MPENHCSIAIYELLCNKSIAGINVIERVSKRITAGQKQTIRQITHKLIGPEIVEETADKDDRSGYAKSR